MPGLPLVVLQASDIWTQTHASVANYKPHEVLCATQPHTPIIHTHSSSNLHFLNNWPAKDWIPSPPTVFVTTCFRLDIYFLFEDYGWRPNRWQALLLPLPPIYSLFASVRAFTPSLSANGARHRGWLCVNLILGVPDNFIPQQSLHTGKAVGVPGLYVPAVYFPWLKLANLVVLGYLVDICHKFDYLVSCRTGCFLISLATVQNKFPEPSPTLQMYTVCWWWMHT